MIENPMVMNIERHDTVSHRRLVVDRCDICGYSILEGDEYYDFDGDIVCEECLLDYAHRYRKQVSA